MKTFLQAPGEHHTWCNTAEEFLYSSDFLHVLEIYNNHTANTRADKPALTVEDIMDDRNVRMRVKSFYETRLEIRLVGASQKEVLAAIDSVIQKVLAILDERNQKLRSKEIELDSPEEQQILHRYIY